MHPHFQPHLRILPVFTGEGWDVLCKRLVVLASSWAHITWCPVKSHWFTCVLLFHWLLKYSENQFITLMNLCNVVSVSNMEIIPAPFFPLWQTFTGNKAIATLMITLGCNWNCIICLCVFLIEELYINLCWERWSWWYRILMDKKMCFSKIISVHMQPLGIFSKIGSYISKS